MSRYLLIAGSRSITDLNLVQSGILKYLKSINLELKDFDGIISGNARGVDTLAIRFANNTGVQCIIMPAQWDRFGKQAGYIRNKNMVALATHAIFFRQHGSPGTSNAIDLAVKKDIPFVVYDLN